MPDPQDNRLSRAVPYAQEQTSPHATTCGAETRKCTSCGHHQMDHGLHAETQTRRGTCLLEGCTACTGFVGRPCKSTLVFPRNGRCKMHGGPSPSGVAHPRYRQGLYSKLLPAKMRERYEAALNDDQLLSLREEIAVMRAHVADALQRANGQAGAGKAALVAAKAAQRAWRAHEAALEGNGNDLPETQARMADAMAALTEACGPARTAMEARAEFRETADKLEKLARSENQRVEMLYNVITSERALALRAAETTAFLEALNEHVGDQAVVRAIRRSVQARFEQLAGRRDAPALGPGGSGPADDGDDPAGPADPEDAG